jgi:hypothetical protein
MPSRPSSRAARLGALAAALGMLLVLGVLFYAKLRLSSPHAAALPHYPDGPNGLKALFTDVLKAADDTDRDRVHDLMASTFMSDDDLRALFGPRAAELAPHYHSMMETMVNRGSIELVVQVYERKLDTVEIIPIDPTAASARDTDKAIARALVTPLKIYDVRLRRAADHKGLRYDFFFYRNGHWLTGNQLGHVLAVGAEASDAGAR